MPPHSVTPLSLIKSNPHGLWHQVKLSPTGNAWVRPCIPDGVRDRIDREEWRRGKRSSCRCATSDQPDASDLNWPWTHGYKVPLLTGVPYPHLPERRIRTLRLALSFVTTSNEWNAIHVAAALDAVRHRPNLPKGLRNRESQRTRETRWVSAFCCAEVDEVPQRHSLLVVHPTTRGMISGPTRARLASVEFIACGFVTVKTAAGPTNAYATASA